MSSSNEAAAGIMISRVSGLLREILLGAVLPITAPAATAFRIAMRIPNVIQNLLGEGSLAASFVPVYAKLVEEKQEAEARRVAGGVLGLLALLITIIVAMLVIGAEVIVNVLGHAQSDEVKELAVKLLRITAPGIGLLGISAWCLGILNSHRQYFLSYVAPTLWNGAQVGVLLVAAIIIQFADGAQDGPDAATIATWLSVAVLIGSALQLAVQVPRVRILTQNVTPHMRREGQVQTVLRRFGPAVGSRGVVQISSLLDLFLAGYLVLGAIPIIALVTPLYLLPISLFGFSVATTELTEMSRQADRADVVARRVRIGLRKVALPAGLCTATLAVGGQPIVGTLYEWTSSLVGRDAVNADAAVVLGATLGVYALALPASMSARISQNALFSLGDVTTPAQIALVRLGVLVAVSVLFMFQADQVYVESGVIHGLENLPQWQFWKPLGADLRSVEGGPPHFGPVGVALGALAASWSEWALLRLRMNRKLHTRVSSGLLLPIVAASSATAAAILFVRVFSPLGNPLQGILVGLVAVATYTGVLWFVGVRPSPTSKQPQGKALPKTRPIGRSKRSRGRR